MVDGGIENFNAAVDELVNDGVLKRILAQTEIAYSNSMIEAFFRRIKHQWLFLNELDIISTVRRLVAFYVNEYTRSFRIALCAAVRQMRHTSGLPMRCRISLPVPEFKRGLRGSNPIAQSRAVTARQRPVDDRACARSTSAFGFEIVCARSNGLILTAHSLGRRVCPRRPADPSPFLAAIGKLDAWSVGRRCSLLRTLSTRIW